MTEKQLKECVEALIKYVELLDILTSANDEIYFLARNVIGGALKERCRKRELEKFSKDLYDISFVRSFSNVYKKIMDEKYD